MTVSGTTGTLPAGGTQAGVFGSMASQKDMFLKLLVAQLKNQDPSSPMDQKDMMAQMAQFTSVEQLQNLAKTMETLTYNSAFSQSVGLIGKQVDFASTTGSGSTSIESSTVKSVQSGGGVIRLLLENGRTIEPGNVVKVS